MLGDSPVPILTVILAYCAMCKYGPILMKDREPFELRSVMIFYNLAQVLINSIGGIGVRNSNFFFRLMNKIFFQTLYYIFIRHDYNFSCHNISYEDDQYGNIVVILTYSYLLMKILDLLDTVRNNSTAKLSSLT